MALNKLRFAFIIAITFSTITIAQNSIYVACWNVENLFDTVNDTNKVDGEFTPAGGKLWTKERLTEKMENLAKVIHYMNKGNGPDILGLVEVEHKYLVDSLAGKYFPERNYKSVSFESPDSRGIQNALLYDADIFDFMDGQPIEVKFFSDYKTRDILYVKLKWQGEYLNIFINHWPSRLGGEETSRSRRINAASILKAYIDNAREEDDKFNNIIIMGDFNDEPDDLSVREVLGAEDPVVITPTYKGNAISLFNLAFEQYKRGAGTHLFEHEYNFLDQIIISDDLFDKTKVDLEPDSFEIIKPSFAETTKGGKNIILPTFDGGVYIKGFSDHYPVAARFVYTE